jgi:hypothetical protein
MVLGSHSVTDLTHEPTDPSWESTLHALLDEVAILRGGNPGPPASLPTAGSSTTDGLAGGYAPSSSAASGGASGGSGSGGGGNGGSGGALEGSTMAQKVARVREELSLDAALPIAKLVAEANAVMGIEGHGPLAKQARAPAAHADTSTHHTPCTHIACDAAHARRRSRTC